ncbi:MAG: hypothetical protein AB7G12_17540 [Thermoanaerobaculia bacterium]
MVIGFGIGLSIGSSFAVISWLAAGAWVRQARRRAFVDGRNIERRARGQQPLPAPEEDEDIWMYGVGS